MRYGGLLSVPMGAYAPSFTLTAKVTSANTGELSAASTSSRSVTA